MAYLERDGVRLHYEDEGSGTPLLLTHGFGASADMWQGQIDAFADRYRIVRWDMRGHGRTECPDDPALYSHAHTIADMVALLDHLEIEKAVIGGHSLGGFMSQAFNAEHPERVMALYLQACGPGYRNDKSRDAWNERAYERADLIEKDGIDAIKHGREVSASERGSAQGLANAARGILTQVNATVIDSLPHIVVPVLIVVGDQDTPFIDGMAYMENRIPDATRIVVAGAGHGVNVEAPEIVNEAIAGFMESL